MAFGKKYGVYGSDRVLYIPVNNILPNPEQPRREFEPASLRELAESIRTYGVLQPLTVRRKGSTYELVAGERRLRAAKLAGEREVPCILLRVDIAEAAILALVENLHRRDLDFVEEAEGLARLIHVHGFSQEKAAKCIGKSQSAVANKLRILRLPPDQLSAIRAFGLTERHARAMLRILDDSLRGRVLDEVVRNGWNVAQTEAYIDALFTAEKKPAAEKRGGQIYALRDIRLFLNSVARGAELMRKSGIDAQVGRSETDSDIILTIQIPKTGRRGRTPTPVGKAEPV